MNDHLLSGLWRWIIPVSRGRWQKQVAANARQLEAGLSFMTPDHQRVRNLVVSELPRAGRPLVPAFIALNLNLPLKQVGALLTDLEKHRTFLVRNAQGAVTWAYPVTVEKTPHQVTLGPEEKIYAAGAVDALATPFVQGQLRGTRLTGLITTECAHCHQPLQIEIDSELKYRVISAGAKPLCFAPLAAIKPGDPSLIDRFLRQSVFFWSEEHARAHRWKVGGVRGTYLTLAQAAYITPILQGVLFAFPRRL